MNVAVVTGAAQGIGLAIAHRLAEDSYSVMITDVNDKKLYAAYGELRARWPHAGINWLAIDWTDPDAPSKCIAACPFGPLTVLVNNAGTCLAGPFQRVSVGDWDKMADINLKAVFFATQAAATEMVRQHTRGRIVNIASIAGRSGRAYQAAYAATKAGVISLTRSAALALAPHGITVNAVCPGVIDTPLTRRIHEQQAEALGLPPDQSLAQMVARVPLGRIGTGADVAGVVSFLCGPDASYITGQALNVCGGLEMN